MRKTLQRKKEEIIVLDQAEYEKLLAQAFNAGYETALSNHRYLKRNQKLARRVKSGHEDV